MAELKKCPFCGGEAVQTFNTRFGYQIFCENTHCFMNEIVTQNMGKSEEAVIEAWNNRVNEFDAEKYEKLILADMERKHTEHEQLLSELKAVLSTTTEAEIRAKAIDEFAEKLLEEVEANPVDVGGRYSYMIPQSFLEGQIKDIADQLKESE